MDAGRVGEAVTPETSSPKACRLEDNMANKLDAGMTLDSGQSAELILQWLVAIAEGAVKDVGGENDGDPTEVMLPWPSRHEFPFLTEMQITRGMRELIGRNICHPMIVDYGLLVCHLTETAFAGCIILHGWN